MNWIPTLNRPEDPRNGAALRDIHPQLRQVVDAFSSAFVARLLGVDPAMVTRWNAGAAISPEMTGRLLDVHAVFSRAFQILPEQLVMRWLHGSEPFFDGARPLDVLALRGAAPLLDALNAIDSGAYA